MEAYLREKKDAILKDRKVEYEADALGGAIGSNTDQEDDKKSCL